MLPGQAGLVTVPSGFKQLLVMVEFSSVVPDTKA